MDFLAVPALILVFFIGASIGSFLNVVIYRLPAGLSLIYPPSRCPHCLTRLKKRENIPVLGWLRLKGKCAHCKSAIAPRYPIIEAVTGILFLIVFWIFGISLQTLGHWTFFSWLLALAMIDLDTMTLPNPLTQSGLVLGLIFQAIIGFSIGGTVGAIQGFISGVIGTIVGIWLLDLIGITGSMILGQPAMGAGDSKLMAMIGAWLGWQLMLLAGFLACLTGAIVGIGALKSGRLSRRQAMPFGPFLALGAGLSLFYGQAMLSHYLRLFTL
ncbi:MAG: prepilin peptidase [Plectolyngbya sp. WJT66-NPBG17]|nr:prepilin peptidase [Plectolyngbya sp. WJT66-NPBG17]MBW4526216.1 prepilin peptidase [Phormidium tanganyikae FI6-MK23]